MEDQADEDRALEDASQRLHNFPVSLTALIGREQAYMAACEMLLRPEVRVLTLTGTGGVGKTRLAIAIAANLPDVFTDGIYFVPLSSTSDPDLVIPTIALILGIKEPEGAALFTDLKNFLLDKRIVLLLDNFERVITAAPLLSELLLACPQMKILVTSRAVLRIQGEYEFMVSPLPLPDLNHLPPIEALARWPVITLFMQRAQAVKPSFQITEANAHDIAAICVRLDGLPLAIELAAARIKLLPPRALLLRLEHRLQILTGGRSDMPARHQTLRDTITWSYDLLDEQEQRLFRHLSVFTGGCSLVAIEAICTMLGDITIPVLDGVTSLLDKSLVLQVERGNDEPRLSLLETVREFGGERIVAHEELVRTCDAHAHYYLELAEEADQASYGSEVALWLDRQELEHDNFRAALRWLLEQKAWEPALRLARALSHFWFLRGYLREGLHWLTRGLEGSEHVTAAVRAKAFYAAGVFAGLLNDYDRAENFCRLSLQLCRELDDARGQVFALWMLGRVSSERNNYAAARLLGECALSVAQKAGDVWGSALSFHCLGTTAFYQGEYERAQSLLENCLQSFKQANDPYFIAEAYRRLADVFFAQDDAVLTQQFIEECLALVQRIGTKWGIAWGLNIRGQVAPHHGEYAQARTLLEQCLAIHKEVWDQKGIAQATALLAKVAAAQQQYTEARTLYKECLEGALKLGDKWFIAAYLEGLGEMVANQGENVWAARLWGTAEKLRQEINAPMPQVARAGYEQMVAKVRASLGEARFNALRTEGQNISPRQALLSQAPPPVVPQDSVAAPGPVCLTRRELEVLRLMAHGLTNAQIGEQLIISHATVNCYLRSIYSKMGVSSRTSAMRYAIDHHLI